MILEYDGEDSAESKVSFYKCMPGAFPAAMRMVDNIYKIYSQTYVKLSEQGPIIDLVCDFVQDQNGIMHFLKIDSYVPQGVAT